MCRFLVWWPDRGGTEGSAKCFEAIDVEERLRSSQTGMIHGTLNTA